MSSEIFMHKASGRNDLPRNVRSFSVMAIMLWLAVSTALIVSVFSVIEEMCLATACRDTAGFTVFGVNMGWFGVAYFTLMLILLWGRNSVNRLDLPLSVMVFAGIGTEFRLLWIQKYIIGSWCPLCVTISCALFIAAILLLIEKVQGAGSGVERSSKLLGWLAFIVAMIAIGLAVAIVGVQALA